MTFRILFTALVIALASHPAALASDAWVAQFYSAPTAEERRAIVEAQDLDRYSFDDLYELLARPPERSADVATGLTKNHTVGARREKFYYSLNVPESYDAKKAYPLVIFLHGDVSRQKPKRNQSWWRIHDDMVNENVIQAFPTGWGDAKWWTAAQLDNFERIISQVKATYNINTNKVFLVGISDGATGGFFMSATAPSAYAGYASVIGFPGVLKGKHIKLKENVYPINMRALKIIAFNTENDYLYPVKRMQVYIDMFREMGIDIEFVPWAEGGHDLGTFKRALPGVWQFVAETQRAPYPDRITWQYEDGSRLHRVNWLEVQELLPASEQASSLAELPPMEDTSKHSGLIELIQKDNAVAVQNHGVASYSLLLSPGQFDFSEPITLIENGSIIHSGRIERSKKTLIEYAIRDFDPARLYGAEVVIAN